MTPPYDPQLCEPSELCPFGTVASGDHYYIFPATDPDVPGTDPVSRTWEEACTKSEQSAERGLPPENSRPPLVWLPAGTLQNWVRAGGSLNHEFVRTITFCGFRIADILNLDWSATDARVRFYQTEIIRIRAGSNDDSQGDEPQGIFPSRGLFSNGLTIDRSELRDGINLHDAHFGSFVEIERSLIKQPFAARNTVVEGALRLRNNKFSHNLRLEALEVAGDTILSHNSFPAEITAAAIEPDGTAGSVVRLRELRLRGVLQVTYNKFVDSERRVIDNAADDREQVSRDAMAKDSPETVTRSFYLQKSLVGDNDVTIADNRFFGHVFLVDIEGKRLSITNNDFKGILQVTGSNFFSLRTYDNRFDNFVQLRSNRLESALIADRDTFGGEAKRIEITGNAIGQEMRIAPRRLPNEGSTLTLTYNRVTGPADLYLPVAPRHLDSLAADFHCEQLKQPHPHAEHARYERPGSARGQVQLLYQHHLKPEYASFKRWRGTVDLTGSQFAASLKIAESCYLGPAFPMVPVSYELEYVKDVLTWWQNDRPCHERGAPPPDVHVNFSLVHVAVLTFDMLPSGCDYVWRGIGLTFGYFGTSYEGKLAKVNGETGNQQTGYDRKTERGLLQAWLRNLEKDSGAFLGISDYLRDRGDFNGSREWLQRAKEAIYWPDPHPMPSLVGAAAARGGETLSQHAGLWQGTKQWLVFLWQWIVYLWQWTKQWAIYLALWPAGFGAMPERVIATIGLLWLGSWSIYSLYWRGWIAAAATWFCTRSRAAARQRWRDWDDERRRMMDAAIEPSSNLTNRHGFVVARTDQVGRRFSLWSYALDVTLPIIPLGRFGVFVADNAFVRGVSYVHHILGWWLGALFIGALTIL